MNWLRGDEYHLVSECRCFRICKFFIAGQAFYESWAGGEMIATRLPSSDAAKAVVTTYVMNNPPESEPTGDSGRREAEPVNDGGFAKEAA